MGRSAPSERCPAAADSRKPPAAPARQCGAAAAQSTVHERNFPPGTQLQEAIVEAHREPAPQARHAKLAAIQRHTSDEALALGFYTSTAPGIATRGNW
ncbi:hypothetical protein [Azorhizophilus paspali]|uniref:Uncharacterized protein n=1 Tax=Azorhizophilus paspali TaxID=69963 RepID=A0ABV6SHS0_AZOPA